jgi:hypothetical protein
MCSRPEARSRWPGWNDRIFAVGQSGIIRSACCGLPLEKTGFGLRYAPSGLWVPATASRRIALLTIRPDQFEVFAQAARDSLAGRVMELLRVERAESVADLDEERLRRRVATGLSRGWAHGIRQDIPLICFASMVVEFGPGFDRHSAVAAVLADPSVARDDVVDAFLERLPRLVWAELEILGAGANWDGP